MTGTGPIKPTEGKEPVQPIKPTAPETGVPSVQETQRGIPISEEMEYKVDPFDEKAVHRQVEKTKEAAENIARVGKLAENEILEDVPSVYHYSEQHGKELLDIARGKAAEAEQWGKFRGGVEAAIESPLGVVKEYGVHPLKKFVGPLAGVKEVKQLGDNVYDVFLHVNMAIKIPELLSSGASLIYKRTVLNEVARQLDLWEASLGEDITPEQEKEIKEAKIWLQQQNDLLDKGALGLGVKAVGFVPSILQCVAVHVPQIANVMGNVNVGALIIAGAIAKVYQFHVAIKDVESHNEWLERMREKPIGEGEFIGEDSQGKIKKDIKALVDKRKNARDARMERERESFDELMRSIMPKDHVGVSDKELFESVKEELKKKHIHLEELGVEDFAGIIEKWEDDTLLRQYVEHKQTVSAQLRNGMKAMLSKKHEVERKFLDFKLNKATTSLIVSSLCYAAIIVIKVLAVVGVIAIGATLIASIGLGLFVVGLMLTGIGLYMMYKHKPNLFKCFFEGVNLKLALYGIPSAFNEWRLQHKQTKKLQKALSLKEINAQRAEMDQLFAKGETRLEDFPEHLQPWVKKLRDQSSKIVRWDDLETVKKEMDKLAEEEAQKLQSDLNWIESEMAPIEADVEIWKKRIKPLKQKLMRAGWADYRRAARLAKDRSGNEMDIAEVIADAIIEDESYLDEETRKIFKEQMGIPLGNLPIEEKGKAKVKEEVKEALINFFAMDDSELLAFIKKQQYMFDFEATGG